MRKDTSRAKPQMRCSNQHKRVEWNSGRPVDNGENRHQEAGLLASVDRLAGESEFSKLSGRDQSSLRLRQASEVSFRLRTSHRPHGLEITTGKVLEM